MNVSLLVGTLNRSDFVIRLLNYYHSLEFRGKILIGDSSNPDHASRTKLAIDRLKGQLDIAYEEQPGLNLGESVRALAQLATTDYVVVLSDDDFLIPSGLESCVRFLDSHPDYVAAHGVAAVLTLAEIGPYGEIQGVGRFKQRPIEGETATERLLDHFGNYSVTLFSVHRVEAWRRMYRDVDQIPDKGIGSEMLPCCLSVVQGKVRELECLSLVRQIHDQRYLLPDSLDWITNPDWQSSYEILRNSLSEELAHHDNIQITDAQEIVKQAFWSYLRRTLNIQWAGRYEASHRDMNHRLRQNLRAIPGLHRSWQKLRSYGSGDKSKFSLPALLRSSSPFHDDFMPILQALSSQVPIELSDEGAIRT